MVSRGRLSQSRGTSATTRVNMVAKKTTKSKVNAAGNYTKPAMRKALFQKIKAGSKGGDPGEWSARKAQLLAVEYKKRGGGYKN